MTRTPTLTGGSGFPSLGSNAAQEKPPAEPGAVGLPLVRRSLSMRLLGTFARRSAAYRAAGAAGLRCVVIAAVVVGVEVSAAGCLIELCDDRIAAAFVPTC